MIYRPQYAAATGWFNAQYAPAMAEVVTALKMLGYNLAQAYKMLSVRGITYDGNYASRQWDASVVVP